MMQTYFVYLLADQSGSNVGNPYESGLNLSIAYHAQLASRFVTHCKESTESGHTDPMSPAQVSLQTIASRPAQDYTFSLMFRELFCSA